MQYIIHEKEQNFSIELYPRVIFFFLKLRRRLVSAYEPEPGKRTCDRSLTQIGIYFLFDSNFHIQNTNYNSLEFQMLTNTNEMY